VKLGIAFLVACEALLCFFSGAMSYGYFFHPRHLGLPDYVKGFAYLLIALLSIWSIAALLRKRRLAWWSSLVIGLVVMGLSSYSIWFGITYANPQTDEGDAVIYGIALLLFALPALLVLFLPATRRYLISPQA